MAQLGSFTDPRDGKTYKTVTIGSQTWMAENLNYNAEGSKCYGNDESNGQKYGRLYDWETAKTVCPSGWHLPSDEEWQNLVNFAGGSKAGAVLKSADGWREGGNGSDSYGFSALPGGYRDSRGDFLKVGYCGFWWSNTENNSSRAYGRDMYYLGADVGRHFTAKSYLYSVRCLQD